MNVCYEMRRFNYNCLKKKTFKEKIVFLQVKISVNSKKTKQALKIKSSENSMFVVTVNILVDS